MNSLDYILPPLCEIELLFIEGAKAPKSSDKFASAARSAQRKVSEGYPISVQLRAASIENAKASDVIESLMSDPENQWCVQAAYQDGLAVLGTRLADFESEGDTHLARACRSLIEVMNNERKMLRGATKKAEQQPAGSWMERILAAERQRISKPRS